MFLPVDDDGGDLLVHEEEDGEEDGGYGGDDVKIPRTRVFNQRDHPAAGVTTSRLEDRGHHQLWCGETKTGVDENKDNYGDDNGIVCHQRPYLGTAKYQSQSVFHRINSLWLGRKG